MGVVTVSSSAARTPLGLNTKFCNNRLKRPLIVAFKGDKHNDSALVATQEKIPVPVETAKKTQKKRIGKTNKLPKRESSPSSMDVDYNEAAAMLENLYKLSPASDNAECIKNNKSGHEGIPTRKKRMVGNKIEKIEELIREYSVSTDFVSMDWKRMRIPPVLSSSEHAWLFKLMQPMKVSIKLLSSFLVPYI